MTFTVVNDYFFKPDGDVEEGKAAAKELVAYFNEDVPEVQLSLWLESDDNPLHHYHITVFDSAAPLEALKKSKAIEKFTGRLYPHIDHSTFISPGCQVWLAAGKGVEDVGGPGIRVLCGSTQPTRLSAQRRRFGRRSKARCLQPAGRSVQPTIMRSLRMGSR